MKWFKRINFCFILIFYGRGRFGERLEAAPGIRRLGLESVPSAFFEGVLEFISL